MQERENRSAFWRAVYLAAMTRASDDLEPMEVIDYAATQADYAMHEWCLRFDPDEDSGGT